MKTHSAKLQELIGLAMKVNEETEYCTFVNFSGHVKWVEIRVAQSKKDYNKDLLESMFDYKRCNEERFDKRYKQMKAVLVSILKTGKIDYEHEDIYSVERVEYDYKF